MIPFTEPGVLHDVLGGKDPKLRIWDVLQENKIFLVNLKDTPTDLFLGSLISAKIQHAIFRRRPIHESDRTPYYLYIDECQTILKYSEDTFDKILTRARKYKLCLALANQLPRKLPAAIQDSLGTMRSLVLFNLDTQDSRIFKDRIVPFAIEDLTNLEKFVAITRVGNSVQLTPTPTYLGPSPASYAENIRKLTIERYGCDAPQVCGTKDDGHSGPKSDDVGAGTAPNVPPHQGKKKSS